VFLILIFPILGNFDHNRSYRPISLLDLLPYKCLGLYIEMCFHLKNFLVGDVGFNESRDVETTVSV